MTEVKKTRTRKPKSTPKADLIDLATEAEVPQAVEHAAAVNAKQGEADLFVFSFGERSEALRQAVRAAVSTSAQGALEVNGKIIEAMNTQGNAAVDLWRTALDNSRSPDGLDTQTNAARQVFETASAQWKDVVETTARWMTKSVEPLQSALLRQDR